MKLRLGGMLLGCLVALLTGIWLAQPKWDWPWSRQSPPPVQGFFWPEQKALQAFELTDHHNTPFTLEQLQDQWTLIFFGYTFCPDICPITMSLIQEAMVYYQAEAPATLANLQVAFISVDGQRDTPEQLAGYIRFYNDQWVAASGNSDQVDSLTDQLGVPYAIEDHEPGAVNYLVYHTGALFLISPETRLAALLQPPFEARKLASDLLAVRRFMANS